jgi:hypothetical protein
MLKLYLVRNKRISFISGNTFEYVLSVKGINILITHGHRLGKMSHNDLSKSISKWSHKGVIINKIMCGHLHETQITDTLLRSGSLVGNNAYSDVSLNLYSRASQNIYIIDNDGNLDAVRVDLQNTIDDMYDISEDLDVYNAKSADKLKERKTIFEVII